MSRRLPHSKRRQLVETGGLSPVDFARVPEPFRGALASVISYHLAPAPNDVETAFKRELSSRTARHSGHPNDQTLVERGSVDDLLDFAELLIKIGPTGFPRTRLDDQLLVHVFPDVESELNELFDRPRFGYRSENGEIRQIGSPLLATEVVGPDLLATRRPGWEEAGRSYREAISHQRKSGEGRDALTSACSAVESSLKAAGYRDQASSRARLLEPDG